MRKRKLGIFDEGQKGALIFGYFSIGIDYSSDMYTIEHQRTIPLNTVFRQTC